MALKPCRECSAQVSTEAEVCPHCGVRSPTADQPSPVSSTVKQTKNAGRGILSLAGFLVIMFIGLAALGISDKRKGLSDSTCITDWARCANNEELAKNYNRWWDVRRECKREADARARYKTEWPWEAFGTFNVGNSYIASGKALAIEPEAQFQNGFGAMVRSRVTCTYDLREDRVISVDISPR
jgi:hypothetical protein